MFRHIAMGRRNWLHSGSHDAAQNIAFMYSLYESCKLNDLNFFDYINDVLTKLMKGETDYKSLIPCRSSYARLLPTGRKNSLTFGSHDGAEVSVIYHTFIETCKMCGVSTLEYFKEFFKATVPNIFEKCRA